LDSVAKTFGWSATTVEADLTRDGIADRLVRLFVVNTSRMLQDEDLKFGPEALLLYQGLSDGRDSLVWASDAALPWRDNCGCGYLNCSATIWLQKHSLFIQIGGSSSQSSQYESVQYRFENGEFVAIGILLKEMGEDIDGAVWEKTTDHNLLTGNFLETVDNVESGKPKVKRSRKPKATRALLRDRYRSCTESVQEP
jgi:hypothetical protein